MKFERIHQDALLIKEFLAQDNATVFFNKLKETVIWHDVLKNDEGVDVKINRKMAYHSDEPVIYKYAGLNLQGDIWSVWSFELCWMINHRRQLEMNSVLLNLYENGKNEIRWHADKEPQLGSNPVIPTLNLGASRVFSFRNLAGERHDVTLNNGDLLIMEENCQKNWQHAVLKDKTVTEPRMSLTFRKI